MFFASNESKGYTASMSRFRDTFDATRGNDEAARKDFDDVKKRANADVYRGRSFVARREENRQAPQAILDKAIDRFEAAMIDPLSAAEQDARR
jgi:hypothetical protein